MTSEPILSAGANLERLETTKEVKLHLPLRTHVRLRAGKLLRGETIAATVNAAVSWYFEQHPIIGSGQTFEAALAE